MLTYRKSDERGSADHGWLQSRFSFSFAEYHDPKHMQFGPLRVINDDYIAPDSGFGMHGHKDMEIISYVLEGELSHKDSMGNGSVIKPGAVQRMSAGKGVMHSEYNHGQQRTHLLQIWIMPNKSGGAPSYEEKTYSPEEKQGRLRLVASEDGREGSVTIQQNALMFVGLFDGEAQQARMPIANGRQVYVHLARGSLQVNSRVLQTGDAVMLTDEALLELGHGQDAEVLVFDLPV